MSDAAIFTLIFAVAIACVLGLVAVSGRLMPERRRSIERVSIAGFYVVLMGCFLVNASFELREEQVWQAAIKLVLAAICLSQAIRGYRDARLFPSWMGDSK